MKIFLITTEVQDNGHEHSGFFMLRSRSEKFARNKADRMCPLEGGVDAEKSPVGYGDGLTRTEIHSVKEITEAESELLQRLNIAHFS